MRSLIGIVATVLVVIVLSKVSPVTAQTRDKTAADAEKPVSVLAANGDMSTPASTSVTADALLKTPNTTREPSAALCGCRRWSISPLRRPVAAGSAYARLKGDSRYV